MLKKFGFILLGILLSLSVISCGKAKKPVDVSSQVETEEITSTLEDTVEEVLVEKETETSETASETENIETEDVTKTEDDVETFEATTEEATEEVTTEEETTEEASFIDPDGTYTTKEDVALYIYTYQKLPQNFMSKKQAEKLGWSGGGLDAYVDGGCIGGSKFGNYEGILPEKDGRTYTECDIDTLHKSKRGAKRIVFSNDGLIFYTEDHYESFVLLYDENGPVLEEIIYGGN